MASFLRVFGIGLLLLLFAVKPCQTIGDNQETRVYDRGTLLSLRDTNAAKAQLFADLPKELLRPPGSSWQDEDGDKPRRQRRRGRRGGARQRLRRRGNKPPLPSLILANVRSLRNKMDKLKLYTRTCNEYRESCAMVFTETALHPDVPSSLVELDGFSLARLDRSFESGKTRGGGLCVYINDKWCRQYTTRETVCNPDIELLCLSLRPFFLPREFGNILICAVYVPPSANAGRAAAHVADCVHRQLQRTPEAPILILGDLNHCKLEMSLPGFDQYIKCNTRKDKILDKCYGNIQKAYTARAMLPLAKSDHNTIHLIPIYRSVLKRSKPLVKTVKIWSTDSIETLKGCYLSTDWDIFHVSDLSTSTDVITSYINFCVEAVIPHKSIKVYPNNKPYITKDIKDCIRRKRLSGNQ